MRDVCLHSLKVNDLIKSIDIRMIIHFMRNWLSFLIYRTLIMKFILQCINWNLTSSTKYLLKFEIAFNLNIFDTFKAISAIHSDIGAGSLVKQSRFIV